MTTVYTKVGCPYCAAAKDDMRARGEGFAEIDILEPGAEAELLKLTKGQRIVPVIVRDGDVQVGFGGG
jgi:glutaredoxin